MTFHFSTKIGNAINNREYIISSAVASSNYLYGYAVDPEQAQIDAATYAGSFFGYAWLKDPTTTYNRYPVFIKIVSIDVDESPCFGLGIISDAAGQKAYLFSGAWYIDGHVRIDYEIASTDYLATAGEYSNIEFFYNGTDGFIKSNTIKNTFTYNLNITNTIYSFTAIMLPSTPMGFTLNSLYLNMDSTYNQEVAVENILETFNGGEVPYSQGLYGQNVDGKYSAIYLDSNTQVPYNYPGKHGYSMVGNVEFTRNLKADVREKRI